MRYGIGVLSLIVLLAYAHTVSAAPAQYVPLVGIPQLKDANANNLADYFNNIYLLTIALGALAAVVKIMIAGVKYSFTDIITSKGDAKNEIQGTLLGLGILLIPFIVLNTIYPKLTSLDILAGATKTNLTEGTTATDNTQDGQQYPPGTVVKQEIKEYSFERTAVTPPTDELTAGVAEYIYDSSGAEADCRSLKGRFQKTSADTGKCTYLRIIEPNPETQICSPEEQNC